MTQRARRVPFRIRPGPPTLVVMLTRLRGAAARRDVLDSPVGASLRLLDRSAERAADAVVAAGALLLGWTRASRGRHRHVALASAVVLLLGLALVSGPLEPATSQARLTTQDVADAPQHLPGVVEVSPARPEARALPAEPAVEPSVPAPAPAGAAPGAGPPGEGTVVRWLPTGTGMWLHEWGASEGGSAPAVVDRALASGLSHLYVQTGSTKKGWIGDEVLTELLPATEGTGLKVIAWDFPKLIDPEADALRMAQAALRRVPGAPRIAAVAPDVETAAEGTQLSRDTVTRYYATLRAALPRDVAVLATVPWPSEKRTGTYPYAETAVHSDAFVPMAYWYNRSPYVVTETSMQWLARFGLPVMPVGQGYDGRLDAPYLAPDPDPAGSVQQFVDAARAGGAASISLWSWQTTGDPQWEVLARAGDARWPASEQPRRRAVPVPAAPAPVEPGLPVP